MKIHFDGVNFSSSTGPNTFAGRLAKALFNAGHEVVDQGPSADVSLVFIECTGARLAPRVVQRLDGVWSRPSEFLQRNVKIKALYDQADAVVFQSDFDRQLITKHWGPPKAHWGPPGALTTVIHNGIELQPVKQITIPRLADMRATYDKIYACSSNWHPQKRLAANVGLFEHLRAKHPNSCLIVLGDRPDVRIASPHVFFTGSVDADTYLQIYAAADWLLHLEYGGHCPNVVVEALSQGTPVACSEVGGTKELVGGYGLVFKEHEPYDFTLYDYDNPPELDVTQHADLPTRQQLDYTPDVLIDIDTVVGRYLDLFKQLYCTPVPV